MANQADVRVRLSAEGQAEVIAAFQKMASAGKAAGAETSASMKLLNDQLKEVGKTLIGGLGLVLVAEKFKEFFKSTLEGAETLTRLSKQTGISTNAIQAFGRAARETGVGQEVATNALAKFTVNVGKAGIGSKASSSALSDLGISVRDFSRLKPDEQFLLVAQRLAAIQDPARRARDEVALFSKAGVQLDQALVKVGQEGLEPFIAHMRTLGIFLDTDSIEAIRRSAESFKELGDSVKGVATQFLLGFTPALQEAADELLKATNTGGSGFKSLGGIVGTVLKGVLLTVETIGKALAAAVAISVTNVKALATSAVQVMSGEYKAAAKTIGDGFKEDIEIVKQFSGDVKDAAVGLFGGDEEKKKPPSAAGGADAGAEGAKAATLAKARLSLLEAKLDNELKLYQAHAVLVKESDRQAYELGTISLTDYYARRARLINGELDKEVGILKAKRAAVAASAIDINDPAGEINQKKELAKLDTEIQVAELKRTSELAANVNEQANAQRRLYDDTLKTEERLLTIAGKKVDAARLKLALDIADLDLQLRKGGATDAQRAGAEATVAGQGAASIDYGAAAAKAKTDLSELTTLTKTYQDRVRDGELFSIEAAQKIVAEQKRLLPELQADAAAMLKLAEATGKAEDIAAAKAYQQQIQAIAASANQLGQAIAQQKQGFENAVGAGINKFLTDAVSGTKTLKQSFSDMARSIVADILKMEINALEAQALKSLFGAGLSGGGSVGASAANVDLAAASGGYIRGPGTSTSDSIPTLLSDKEYVVNAKATAQPGILPLLTAINQGALKGIGGSTSVPKFATGGQVGGQSVAPNIKFVNVLDPSTLGDHLATAAGERSVLNIISRNPSRVRSSLG
jgi:hypothetical protein